MNLKRLHLQQFILDIIFTILGYFFWDWSLLIIIIFYLLDFFISETFTYRKIWKSKQAQEVKLNPIFYISIFCFLASVIAMTLYIKWIFEIEFNPENNQWVSIKEFMKSDGIFFIPLIGLNYYLMDKMTFFKLKKEYQFDVSKEIKRQFILLISGIILAIIGLLLYQFISVKDITFIAIILIGRAIYEFIIKQKLLKISPF